MKKKLLLGVSGFLAALVLAACGNAAEDTATPAAPTDNVNVDETADSGREIIRIDWLAGHDSNPVAEDDEFIAWLNERFDVEIYTWFLERSEFVELLTLRMTGGEIPDVWMMPDTSSFAQFVGQGVIMELPLETIQQNMPATFEWISELGGEELFDVTTFDGRNYGISTFQRRWSL